MSFCKKATYPSNEQAQKEAKSQLLTRGIKLRAYFCPDCKFYHLTTQSRKAFREKETTAAELGPFDLSKVKLKKYKRGVPKFKK
jgi:hypothetical protein